MALIRQSARPRNRAGLAPTVQNRFCIDAVGRQPQCGGRAPLCIALQREVAAMAGGKIPDDA
jgi:hypothetical protein